jgi:hypothetical protein
MQGIGFIMYLPVIYEWSSVCNLFLFIFGWETFKGIICFWKIFFGYIDSSIVIS